jgi:hypothetical protein
MSSILPIFTKKAHGDVGQDKIAKLRDHKAFGQPAAHVDIWRTQQTSKKAQQSQIDATNTGPTEPLTLHVPIVLKDRIREIAKRESIQSPDHRPVSLSEVGGRYLSRGLQHHVDMQYGALWEPIMQRIIEKEMRVFRLQLRWLLVRVAFDANQTRSLVTNILSMQPGVTTEVRDNILEKTAEAAKTNVIMRSPKLASLVEAYDRHMQSQELEIE